MRWLRTQANTVFNYFRPPQSVVSIPMDDNVTITVHEEEENGDQITTVEQTEHSIHAWQVIYNLASFLLVKENLPRIAIAGVLTGLSTGLNFLSPYLLGETINALSSNDETSTVAGFELSRTTLITLLVGTYSLAQIVPNLRDQILVPVSTNNTKRILEISTEHLLKKSLDYHVNTEFGRQLRFMQKSFSVSAVATPLLTQITPTIVEISIASTILSNRYGLPMGGGILALLAAYTVYSAAAAKPIVASREEILQKGNAAFESFSSALGRYKTIRDCGKLPYTMQEVSESLRQMTEADTRGSLLPLRVGLGHYGISRVSMLFAVLYTGLGIKSGRFSVSDFIFLFGYLNELAVLLPNFGQAVNQLVASYPDLRFVFSELAIPDEVVDLHPEVPLLIEPSAAPQIRFENITFRYPPKANETRNRPLFQQLSFTVPAGQTVAVVSESGAGKTTLFNLLYGYYTPNQGTIYIDGEAIDKVSLDSLQSQISLLGQNPNLFKGSIRDNICFGASHPKAVSDDEIYDLARQVNLYDFLQSFSDKLDTDVGENGKTLSGGQQQKVAILRGLLKQSPIRLLDEVTAPLDSQSATQVLAGIKSLSQNITTLMITHKLTEAQEADQIVVISEGRVLAQDTHANLLETCELYQRLWTAYTTQNTFPAEPASDGSTGMMLSLLGDRGVNLEEVSQLPVELEDDNHIDIEEVSETMASISNNMR